MREYSIPALAEIPASANAADVVTRRAAEQPQAVMLRRKTADGTWSDVTAAQFAAEVQALARGFIAAGVQAGDRIALMSHTRYEWTLIDYALWTAGAIVVPIYETSSPEQAEWILANSAARAVIAETDGFAAMISDARDRLPALEHLWLLSRAARDHVGRVAPCRDLRQCGNAVLEQRTSPFSVHPSLCFIS
ncbi:MAG TPA: AMP-binding protein [Trebonia sp.]